MAFTTNSKAYKSVIADILVGRSGIPIKIGNCIFSGTVTDGDIVSSADIETSADLRAVTPKSVLY
jgi:hypothetical protein